MNASAATGQTTSFTYQGQLSDGNALANGSYDLRFGLFDNAAGGAQIGSNQTVPAVPVSDGVFTVQLDFGVNAFPGANRFVEISVKPAGTGSFTTLAPRQQISSSPYAIRTLSAASADALSSACVGCVQSSQINSVEGSKVTGTIAAASVPTGSGNYVQNTTTQQANANFNIAGNGVIGGNLTVAGTLNANVGGNFIQNRTTPQANANFNISGDGTLGGTLSATNVGVGTTAPNHRLRISGGPPWTSAFWSGALELDNASAIGWHANSDDVRFGIGQTDGGLFFFHTASDPGTTGSAANYDLLIADSGNVGIGTSTPQSKLSLEAEGYGFTHTFEGATLATYVDGLGGAVGTRSNHPLSFFTNNSPSALTLATNGSVGVGTFTPTTALDVRGNLTLDAGSSPGVFTGTANTELNRYLLLLNSPTLQSASGLKAGGILVSDSYSYANPGKNDLVVKGTTSIGANTSVGGNVSLGGNAIQNRDKGGWVKAMAYIDGGSGTVQIIRCYNSQPTGAPCVTVTRLGVGVYRVDFGFQINDRFVSVTAQYGPGHTAANNMGANFVFSGPTTVDVVIYDANDGDDSYDWAFMIFVY